jgi:hypothetical protein
VKLEVTLFNPFTNPPLWAGGYNWVVAVPKYRGDNKEQLEMEAKFALSRVELPATSITENQTPYQPPSVLKRLFYEPKNEELTSKRGIPPNIGIWSHIELMNNIHPTLPVYSVLYIQDFENFIRGLGQ